jgi:hypothetical protein
VNPTDWPLPARILVSVAALLAATLVVWLILGVGGPSAADTGPAAPTASPNPEVAGAANRSSSIIADSGQAGSTAAGATPVDAPTTRTITSTTTSIPLVFGEQDIAAASAVAAAWVSGIATIKWDEDQQVRTDRLRAYLADDQDPALTRWVAPSSTTLTDLSSTHAVLTANAVVDQVVTIARGSILLQVTVTQASVRDGSPAKSASSSYIVTVVPHDGTWLVSAMIGAADGDPGY